MPVVLLVVPVPLETTLTVTGNVNPDPTETAPVPLLVSVILSMTVPSAVAVGSKLRSATMASCEGNFLISLTPLAPPKPTLHVFAHGLTGRILCGRFRRHKQKSREFS